MKQLSAPSSFYKLEQRNKVTAFETNMSDTEVEQRIVYTWSMNLKLIHFDTSATDTNSDPLTLMVL